MPYIEKLILYPIKSLDGVEVHEAHITAAGSLYLDRAFALYNAAGRTVNAKKYPYIQRIRSQYDLPEMQATFSVDGQKQTFHLEDEQTQIADFFSEYLKEAVTMKQNMNAGFPDDDENSGPTIVSTATFEVLQEWFPGLTLESLRQRFRANIELGGCDAAFWEDRLFAHPGVNKRFRLGEVEVIGKQPCARCAVPTRDPLSGESDREFMKTFIDKRKQSLPSFANEAQFDHFYRLCVNTIIPPTESAKMLNTGDSVVL